MIQVYAPTEDADDVDKDAFYDELQTVLDEVTSFILMGAFNTQIGPD